MPAREIEVDARYAALYVQDQISIGERWDVLAGVRWDDVQQTTAFQITKDNVATSDPDNSGFLLVTGQQRVRGLEMDITGELTQNWRLILGAGYLDAHVTRDSVIPVGNRLRGVPRVGASAWSIYHVASGPLYGLTLSAGAVHVGEREGDLNNSSGIAGYTRFDASATYRFGGRDQLALMLRNVANHFYIEQPVTQTTNYPGALRSLSATLSVDF
ncbi:TonB-dependent receptor domain-containing protein [Xanthomonas populi]|uniref:TonB-dependent receptor domain-containing protein n=1 Tax=Xanthomonas populi TaxID=53414 RepID=UPI001FC91B43|nr:TonB-dependent receptor [Xanthomonas populi]